MIDKYLKEYDLVTIPVRVNKTIQEVLNMYIQFRVPFKVLMNDYLAVISKSKTQEAFNPWLYHYKGIEHQEIESGISVHEKAFDFGAMKLIKQKPTDVIKAAFYKRRNDSGFECGFLLDEFWGNLNDESVLVVNPSPDMILKCEEKRNGNCYAVIDSTIAALYKIQFPKAIFFCIEEIPDRYFDRILIVNRDYPIKQTEMVMKWIQCCQGHVLAMLPNAYVDNVKYKALSLMEKEGLAIEKVLLLDSAITVTSPRKKCLVYMKKNAIQDTYWKLENTKVSKDRKFKILDKSVSIEHERYWKENSTLIKLWNNTEYVEPKETKSKDSKEYIFSKEIHLFFSIYAARKNRYAGTCWYKQIKNIEPFIFGKRVSPIVEKGLRAKTVEEVIGNLSKIVLDDRVYPYVYTDMINYFVKEGIAVTLKTLWIIVRNELLYDRKYDEGIMIELFELGGREFGEYVLEKQTEEELLELLMNALQVKEIPTKYLEQLNLLFTVAKKEKHIPYNPLKEIMESVKKQASDRQQEVRDALTKKHFSDSEEKRIFDYLSEQIWNDVFRKNMPKCVTDSEYLLPLIRLFTGMSLREVCALQWNDFEKIDGTKEYQLKVSKFIDLKGKVITHASKEDWIKFRCVPVARPLRILLQQRKEYLFARNIDSKRLESMPIITTTEDISELKKSKISFCKLSKAQDFCRRTLKHAQIEKQELVLPDANGELVTDIYKYGGDIFVTNVKMRLNHECGLTLGEICYILGVKANDTFANHYCDYSNQLLQYAMVEKMNRWTAEYESMINNLAEARFEKGTWKKNKLQISTGLYKKKCASCEIILISESDAPCNLKLQISASHEPKVKINQYRGE